MNTIKHEMFTVEMTNEELKDLVSQHILSKFPQLRDEKVWSWEDFDIKFDFKQSESDRVAVFSMWTKVDNDFNEKPKCKGECFTCNKIDPFNTVCR